MKRELQLPIDELARKNMEFQQSVAAMLAELKTRKEMAAATTQHGIAFEKRLADWLELESQRLGDRFESTGNVPGLISRSKKGDVVIRLGEDSAAPNAAIVFEAKDVKNFTQKQALDEMEEALKNRGAQLGVFVWAARTAPPNAEPLARHGNVLLMVWDDEDPSANVFLKAGYSTARALAIRQARAEAEATESMTTLEKTTREVEKEIDRVSKVRTYANTSLSSAQKILTEVDIMQADLEKYVARLDGVVAALKQGDESP